jgi:transcriptional regulator with XRE-family HTH domain
MNENYGEQIKNYRLSLGMTQKQIAKELDVTPGYISNIENGRASMSLRLLIYYSKLMGITLDELVGNIEPDYKKTSTDNALWAVIQALDDEQKEKLIKTIKLWKK